MGQSLGACARLAAVAGLVFGVSWSIAADTLDADQMKGPLPTDPRLVQGELQNGLKYIVVRHSNPPGRVNMYLNVSSGSLNETEEQRGIAHYLEHMAFNGSRNFAPSTLVPLFESLGLTFGRHQNAFTSFEQTAYILSLPDTSEEKLEKAMLFMSDVAFNLTLDPKEIDEERQIILEEKRARLSPQARVQEEMLKQISPGWLVGERLPIGTEQTIQSVQQNNFKDYYSKWYQPSNMTVIVVADESPAPIIDRIKQHFSQGEKTPRPVDVDARPTPTTGTRGLVLTDAEMRSCSVGMTRLGAPDSPTDTYEEVRERMVEDIAQAAFNRRIDAKVSRGTLKSLGGSASAGTQFNSVKFMGVDFRCKPEEWRTALAEMGTEVQRARLHGFTQREIDDVKKAILASAERAVETESTAPAAMLVRSINNSVASGETFTSAAQDLAMVKAFLPTITLGEVNERFTSLFDPSHAVFMFEGPTDVGAPSNEEFHSMALTAFAVRPEAEKEEARAESLLDHAPAPGTVHDLTTHEASSVTSAWLGNGVRVHHRFMDIRKDQATISINLAAGTIQETAQNRGISDVAELAWRQPATSRLSSTEVRDLMTGKKVNVGAGGGFGGRRGAGGGPDTMTLTVSGSPSDLEAGMQLAHLLLTDPVIEQSAFDQWKQRQKEAIEARAKEPGAAFGALLMKTVYPTDDVRTQPLTMEQLNALTLPAAQAWLSNAVRTAPIEVAVVGDISQERAFELAAMYLGSINPRARITSSTLDELRVLNRPDGAKEVVEELSTQTPMAMVFGGFYTADADNVPHHRAMTMAAQTLSSRMIKVIREQEQLVYSISATNNAGSAWPGFGMFGSMVPTDRSKALALVNKIREMINEFARTGPTEEEMATVKKQLQNTFDEQMKEPGTWVSRMGTMGYRNLSLDDFMAANDAYQAMTAQQVKDVFNIYYKPERFMSAVLLPKE